MSADNIIAFVDLLGKKPELFSEHQTSLWELSESWPDDLGAISKKIIRWCKEHNVYGEFLKMVPDTTRGPGGMKNLNVERAKELIANAIRQSIPDKPNNNDQNKPSSKTSQS
ncbi:MAG: hypothetical protein GDA56_01350 [Hormoscilla sp. GM7CHS1pb]|nr:hypothetical protein [Hormoscilla sp. GM7CHS1pb]